MASTAELEDPKPILRASLAREVDFGACLKEQLATRDAIAQGGEGPRLFMVEHLPALTLGRRAKGEDVLWTPEQLAEVGMAVFETPRGGEATLHAPGQLVAYPIVHVGRQIRAHIVRLADTSIALLEELGIEGARFEMGHPGVWIGDKKIASIGIHVSRGVTVQGLSLNLDVAPGLFGALVSCGMPQIEMLSARALATKPWPGFDALGRRWAELYAQAIGHELRWLDG